MMKYLVPRAGGKTTAAILEAEQTNGYIVCFSEVECDRVWELSRKLGKKIRMPITWDEFINDRGAFPNIKYHIDNLDMCLERMTHKEIASVYLTENEI